MSLLNDEPTLEDRLERDHLVREVGDVVARCDPPQVFGIRGFLAEAIDKLLPAPADDKPRPRLVVLIDDLDRCEGEWTGCATRRRTSWR